MDKQNNFWIEYCFKFLDRADIPDLKFTVYINKETLIALPPEGCKHSEWTGLKFNKCDICPLNESENRDCPIAYNLSGLFEHFSDVLSIEKVEITVNVLERSYYRKDTIQQGLRSIFGIYMAASGCPHMNVLKPMVKFHLPFASIEETVYRHVSNYLLGQYYDNIDGKKADFVFEELIKKNKFVDEVNHGICRRIENINEGDANKNALTILNIAGLMVNLELENRLDSLKYLFKNW